MQIHNYPRRWRKEFFEVDGVGRSPFRGFLIGIVILVSSYLFSEHQMKIIFLGIFALGYTIIITTFRAVKWRKVNSHSKKNA